MSKPTPRPSPATIIALIALFVALGGTGYAAIVIPNNSIGTHQIKPGGVRSPDIRNHAIRSIDVRNLTLRGRDIKPNSLRSNQIAESTLTTVPHATNADTVGGLTPNQLKVSCPAGTIPASAACIETSSRPPQSWALANTACYLAGRRLPTYAELVGGFLSSQRPVAPGGELTANVGESTTTPGQLDTTIVLNNGGSNIEFIDATANTQRGYRCAAAATN